MLNVGGGIETEATITRLDHDRFYVVANIFAEGRLADLFDQQRRPGESFKVTNLSRELGVLVVAGPLSRSVMEKLSKHDFSNTAFPFFTAAPLPDISANCLAIRASFTGELAWELHLPHEEMKNVYERLMDAGAPFGIKPFGSLAMNSLRIEKSYRTAAELTPNLSMVEVDMLRFVSFEKGDFVGRAATEAIRKAGTEDVLVTLQIDATDADCSGGEPVFAPTGQLVGSVSSGDYGHHVKASLALAFVKRSNSLPGAELLVDILGERRRATVLSGPAYDPENRRLRGNGTDRGSILNADQDSFTSNDSGSERDMMKVAGS
ncbi:dimethylglycine dehydrogenase [Paracoccus thiocyanatus]|uniref:Dimethylglycine dehydrogenase n=1 Tax=Paracoccus thiocyanatus TaxID=34006 RepID=A0A1N6QKN4_9RHOB|nr:aminomethyltransferase family protein [Paracoccus thiocyanatus]SIQ17191.1 dimethylglycine dehydrogenase [Paracoccus thiocyanatus]